MNPTLCFIAVDILEKFTTINTLVSAVFFMFSIRKEICAYNFARFYRTLNWTLMKVKMLSVQVIPTVK